MLDEYLARLEECQPASNESSLHCRIKLEGDMHLDPARHNPSAEQVAARELGLTGVHGGGRIFRDPFGFLGRSWCGGSGEPFM